MVKIFIDPGHGGTDPGAVGNGLLEKVLTLTISYKIRDLLLQFEGVQVKLSREGDQTLSLKQRTDMANKWGADFLLSVHINAGGGTGFESFIHPNSSAASIAHQNVIHPEIMKLLDFVDREKKRKNLHMVRESKMPAILTEYGFIDNANDAAKLKQDVYLNKIAQGHVNGLVKAFGLKKKEGVVSVDGELSKEQEKIRQEAISLRITDGKEPHGEINRLYLWSAMIPLARRVEELEKKLK
ncbi:N-acetylmuramoyl-L-alanine amidase [Cytobacillus solani]|uniref:N-acetylmuramoyl-L-alanine amidase n=1 Tax=Cytobacillus solani TaxID=1637975 RepID=UPI00207A2E84|nr:N-acetylmuramoyl-L-alanine amidase [Cytobacillus solani]USK56587.1 N-acetylmuramoyl-L-alanine amidase [Cytobacillus solani]